jgi:nucleoside 2-deoxyribosyltransferase
MEDTKPRAFAFVLMPFTESFGDIYEVGIKAACRDAGAYCERVDEQIFEESILERVYNQIAKADLIVAEMTGRNPNVFYEVGYAHALNKQVILLTQNSEDIPFDLKHYPHIVYGGKIATLKSQLEARVRWCIENPKESLTKVDWRLDFFIDGIPIQEAKHVRGDAGAVSMTLGIHNPTTRMISSETFDLAISAPSYIRMGTAGARSVTAQPNGDRIFNLNRLPSIFPGGWESIGLRFHDERRDVGGLEDHCQVILRLFKEVGSEDYPFSLVWNWRPNPTGEADGSAAEPSQK